MILFDQLSRNAFRGTPEAFQYDPQALEVTRTDGEGGGFRWCLRGRWCLTDGRHRLPSVRDRSELMEIRKAGRHEPQRVD